MPSKMRSKNVPLSWLCENITKCDTVVRGTHMFMLLFIGTFLCPDLGSTVNLHYLWSLRHIEKIKNYDWGGMTYATLLHFMTQLSRRSLSSLGGAPFVWQVRFGIFGYVWVLESYFGYVVMVLWICFFRFGYMNTLELVLKFERRLIAFFLDFFVGCPHLSMPSRFSLEIWLLVIDNLTADDVSPFPLPFCVWVCVYGIFGA